MNMNKIYTFLLSFLILLFFVTGASSQETIVRSPAEEPEAILGPTSMPGLGGWHGNDPAVAVAFINDTEDRAEGEEEIVGDTGKPGLGGWTGNEPLNLVSVSDKDEGRSELEEPLGDTGKPGLGGISAN